MSSNVSKCSEGILAGELKHGPLALIDEHMPIIMIVMRDQTFGKSQNALQQIVARAGKPIVICQQGDVLSAGGTVLRTIEVPPTVDCLQVFVFFFFVFKFLKLDFFPLLQSILTVIPLQLLAYHIATLRGLDVDCPRMSSLQIGFFCVRDLRPFVSC
jgi:glucosamine--fructose-6-phosphate aminotransferase (isomerizing)